MPQKVIWHLRMNREGRTCVARETHELRGTMRGVLVEVVRMQERMAIEQMSLDTLIVAFPYASESGQEKPAPKTVEAARQYLVHAANAGAPREVVNLLTKLYKPKAGLRARLEAMLAPKPTKEEDPC